MSPSATGVWLAVGAFRIPANQVQVANLTQPASEWRLFPPLNKVMEQIRTACDSGLAKAEFLRLPQSDILVRLYLMPADFGGRRTASALRGTRRRAARKAIAQLLNIIDCNPTSWQGLGTDQDTIGLFAKKSEKVQVSDIYSSMPSPVPFPVPEGTGARTCKLLSRCTRRRAPRGMKSTLFGYQKNTLWKLVQREVLPQMVLDPNMVEFQTADTQQPYYYCVDTGEVCKDPVFYEDSTGGIICEDMGVGKTCICIALILHTRHQTSQPPVDCVDGEVHVELDTTWRAFLTDSNDSSGSENGSSPHRPVLSLQQLAARSILTQDVPFKNFERKLPEHLYQLLRRSRKSYFKAPTEAYRFSRSELEAKPASRVFLSSATLIVVPDTLVDQWRTELNKHVFDLVLEVLVLTRNSDKTPSETELLEYDIVLISSTRFGRELNASAKYKDDDDELYKSPLLGVRWLRLIVDEGHVMASRDASQTLLAAKLECDRRWVCTGTPMPNVLRTQIGDEEKQDVQKLGGLLSGFLKVEPYASSKDVYRNVIAKPFLEQQFRGYEKLRDLMHRVMVRNRPEDVERDIQLPPLQEKIVRLAFGKTQRITHNCIIAFIGANAVLSQREHRDYFFHARSTAALRDVISNLQESCFWFSPVGFLKDVNGTLQNVQDGIIHASDRNYPLADKEHLISIARTLQNAQEEALWTHLMPTGELMYEVRSTAADLDAKAVAVSPDGTMLLKGADIESHLQAVKTGTATVGSEDSPAEIVATSSVKLTYLANEIRKYAKDEKIIIYCQFEREIFYCHQLCRLLQVRCILFHKQMRVSERSHSVTTFNTSDQASVMIMDLRLGAWGIDLSSASRVYFTSPVWQHDMERQAIKRAHRIGAHRPVFVETLVVRGTLEEAIVSRRVEMEMKDDADGGAGAGSTSTATPPTKTILEDSKLRDLLSAAKWVDANDEGEAGGQPFARLEVGIPLTRGSRLADYYAESSSANGTGSEKRTLPHEGGEGDPSTEILEVTTKKVRFE
ncbi:SNF2 family N-terminal domain-containing protein [Powellomyces hirtus]|nr:SNF2 family N-terminal domain-containing protein [Powellomyces hirtus]